MVQQEAFHSAQVPFIGAASPLSHRSLLHSASTTLILSLEIPVLSLGDSDQIPPDRYEDLSRDRSRVHCFLILSLWSFNEKTEVRGW